MIYLKRNNKQDANFTAPNDTDWFKPGYIYQLISLNRYTIKPASVLLRVRSPFSDNWIELYADLNCFDYVRGLSNE